MEKMNKYTKAVRPICSINKDGEYQFKIDGIPSKRNRRSTDGEPSNWKCLIKEEKNHE